ncbi:unnamed protein product [Colias eurytheme]|nr:unnamed protein product [Colias eurytheme]
MPPESEEIETEIAEEEVIEEFVVIQEMLNDFIQENPDYEGSSSDDDEDIAEDNLPLSALASWQKKPFNSKTLADGAIREPVEILTPYVYFERYCNVELMEEMALTTNQYYMANTDIQMKPPCSLLDM